MSLPAAFTELPAAMLWPFSPPPLVLSLKFKASETQTGHIVPPRAQHQHHRCTLRCPQPAERCRRGQGTGDGAAPAPGLPEGLVPLPSAAAALEELLGVVPAACQELP